MKIIFQIMICISLAACSSIKPIHRPITSSGEDGVTLNFDKDLGNKTQDGNAVELKKPEESIRIGDKGGEVYTEKTGSEVSNREIKKLKIGLALGPGLNRSVNYIVALKVLEKQGLGPQIITGTEMGAVIAGLYASGVTPEMIEWMFFKYFKEKKKYKPFEKDWISEIDQFFLQKIKNSKLEDSKIKIFLTLFDHNSKKTYYFDKGNIRDLVLINFRLTNNPLKYATGQIYSGSFEKEVFNSKLLNSVGSDFTIALDALGSTIDLETQNEFLVGVLGKVIGKSRTEKTSFDYVLNLSNIKMKLDSSMDATIAMHEANNTVLKSISLLKKKLQIKSDTLNFQVEIKE